MTRCVCYDEASGEEGRGADLCRVGIDVYVRCARRATQYLVPLDGYSGDEMTVCDDHAARVLADGTHEAQPYRVAS